MASFKEHIDTHNLPEHVAVIMDGNGRWAKNKGAARIFGHRNAIEAVRQVIEGAGEIGIKYLTLYAFSTENWGRPKEEVDALMELLVNTLQKEIERLHKNKVRLKTIGDIGQLPKDCRENLREATESTKNNTGLTLLIALNYSGRQEILKAVSEVAMKVKGGTLEVEEIDEQLFASFLDTKNIPDPALLIRTSGEMRISNFLLWQIAYTELYITQKLWPDFRKEDLYEAICEYQKRERRFGKVLTPIA
ncbi:MAG: isoprenyl transferase [Cytophagales bacterium]|nr:isoprenyl transferase [Cytophagales bacterium]MCA6386620.1 isoprenyl transferase [Cytophagales bacterium]MCA6389870.1 isoprenyl transferase [Cytophagales bacterium]MCA6396717.1 isoprenyl transferase [Cytophagales bacterium]MCA6398624.1 isoprenyl transferase [Cytophagales bacterium]